MELQVQRYLRSGKTFDDLTAEFGITCRKYPEGIVRLNYDQIESPKSHPIVIECRALTLDVDTFDVVSISFDRFFNYGEVPEITSRLSFADALVYEKVDGSLIPIYWCDRTARWEISTRGMAFAEGENMTGRKFRELVHEAGGWASEDDFQHFADRHFSKGSTYTFELIGPANRVVTRYDTAMLVLLTVRNNTTLRELSPLAVSVLAVDLAASGGNIRAVRSWKMDTAEAIVAAAAALTGLEEGFVVHDPVNNVRVKIKSPMYVAVHHIRDNGVLSPRRISELVLRNEHPEYLTYFPEDLPFFQPFIDAYADLLAELERVYASVQHHEQQKDFALAVKASGIACTGALFEARKTKTTPSHAFNAMREGARVEVLVQRVHGSKGS